MILNSRSVISHVCGGAPLGLLVACVLLATVAAAIADGAWKERAQEVWDEKQQAHVTRIYRVWDLHPELDLEFQWQPEDSDAPYPAGGIVEGKGKLTWRRKGAADYDMRAVASEYDGEMKNGRPDGQGRLVLRSGRIYAGAWKNGFMDGRGAIKLENGDDYEGEFSADRMHGQGRYAAADGTIYAGEFKNGRRDGTGVLTTADGRSYRTKWRDGKEVAREPASASSTGGAQPRGAQIGRTERGLTVRMLVDRRQNQEFVSGGAGLPNYVYEAENLPGSMSVQLASKQIMDAWRGNGTLRALKDDADGYVKELAQFAPVFLVAEVDNADVRSARVNSAYLSVEASTPDLLPFLQISPNPYEVDCGNEPETPAVVFTNYGWAPVRNARLTYSFGTNSSRTQEFVVDLNAFDVSKHAVVVDGLRRSRFDSEAMRRLGGGHCPSLSELPACLQRVEATGVLGDLTGRVFTRRETAFTNIAGRIEYEWVGSDGRANTRASVISIDIPLFRFDVQFAAECGGPGAVEHAGRTVSLALDKRNYRIPVNWRGELGPRENKRFAFSLVAAKSSHHVFRLVLDLADGTTLASRTVDLTYFNPRIPQKDQ